MNSGTFDSRRIKLLIRLALADTPNDTDIWNWVYDASTESTPRPRPIRSPTQQPPLSQDSSGLVNSSEFRHDVDPILQMGLEHLYVRVRDFHNAFFGDVPDLDQVSADVFRRCTEGDNPLFKEGWSEWPASAQESDVFAWFGGLIPELEAFASHRISVPASKRKLLALPKTSLVGSAGRRSVDIGFVNGDSTSSPHSEVPGHRWSHILVAGALKSNPSADTASVAWTDLARNAREVFAAQDTRRFVLGFTLCGSLMRVWEFDRLGCIASEPFDINKEEGGLQFVTTVLGFLRMDEEMLGFDPTIISSGSQRYIEIERKDGKERLVIDGVIYRARCIAGRATTCWKAHREGDPQTPLVVKDSWQRTDQGNEGELH